MNTWTTRNWWKIFSCCNFQLWKKVNLNVLLLHYGNKISVVPISPPCWNFVSYNLQSVSKCKVPCSTEVNHTLLLFYRKVSDFYIRILQYQALRSTRYHWVIEGNYTNTRIIGIYPTVWIKCKLIILFVLFDDLMYYVMKQIQLKYEFLTDLSNILRLRNLRTSNYFEM